MMNKLVALYSRVSTHLQYKENQSLKMGKWLDMSGVSNEHVITFNDICSGVFSSRPQLDRMVQAIKEGEIGTVVVYDLSRLGRNVSHLLDMFNLFKKYNIKFVSLKENIDSSTPSGKMMFTILAAFSAFEREVMIERVKAGLDRARSQGKRLGRPPGAKDRNKHRRKYGYYQRWNRVREQGVFK